MATLLMMALMVVGMILSESNLAMGVILFAAGVFMSRLCLVRDLDDIMGVLLLLAAVGTAAVFIKFILAAVP